MNARLHVKRCGTIVQGLFLLAALAVAAQGAPTRGPLRVHPENPRYFADAGGKAVYLVGSHTWNNFQEVGLAGAKPFDNEAWLKFMNEYQFNFMRLWVWEQAAWVTWSAEKALFSPVLYKRTGPGTALDGEPKFDLTQFNPEYFERLRQRVITARDRGVYVGVMLFQGFSDARRKTTSPKKNPFRGHPYNAANNVQGFNGDPDNDSMLNLNDAGVRKQQEAYIRKVVETVRDLDNVLYEVTNEGGNPEWSEFVVRTVHEAEKNSDPKHLVGITGNGGVKLTEMLASACEWVSPGQMDDPSFKGVKSDPPAWNQKKPSLLDTDHVWGHGIDYKWVWRSFTRGHHVLFMDPRIPLVGWVTPDRPERTPERNSADYPGYEEGRLAMRNTARLAARLDLARMAPHPELASSKFCLADPGRAYVAYLPNGGDVEVDLSAARGELSVEWIAPVQGKIVGKSKVQGGKKETLAAPFPNDAVVVIQQVENY